jgi:hypothetical protein
MLAVVALLFGACASTYRNPNTGSGEFAAAIKVGDFVTCTMRDGSVKAFRVSQRDALWLVGKSSGGQLLGAYLPSTEKITASRRGGGGDAEFIFTAISLGIEIGSPAQELPAWALGARR